MTTQNEWQEFFDGHAPEYMKNCFTQNTLAEVDFLIEEMGIPAGGSVLDVGCGTGRHAVELAKRGYRVTGVDLSAGMLAEAEKAAREAGVNVEFVQANAAEFQTDKRFDAVVCLCEGAFCLMGPDDDPVDRDIAILRNISAALKPGAKFILTALNGLRYARQYGREDAESGAFDPVTMTEVSTMEYETPDGKKNVVTRERGYVPTELALMCRIAGLEVENIWGGTAGNWGRRPIDLDEIEIMLVAHKAET